MPIDLSDRIIQPPPKVPVRLHPIRRIIQIAMGATIVLLPLANGLRVDVTSGYFWLMGQKFTSQNTILLFYSCAVAVLLLLSVSMVYGRWWCGWVCPQTLASDFGDSLKARIRSVFRPLGKYGDRLYKLSWSFIMVAMAVATAAVVLCYFYPSTRVWSDFLHPGTDSRITIHLAIVGTVIGLNLLFVRRNFCRRGCPYGLMLSIIGDRDTMTVRYLWERDEDCISCGKCVTVCPMNIDIKDGPNQMECIGCGECIDACNDILPMIKGNPKPGLIELRYGIDPMRKTSRLSFAQKIGLWDRRRVFLCAIVTLLAVALLYNMFGTRPTSITIVPSGTITRDSALLFERYDVNIVNGEPRDEQFSLAATGIDRLYLFKTEPVIDIARSAQKTVRITLASPIAYLIAGQRYPIDVTVRSLDRSNEQHQAETIFYVPNSTTPLKAG